MVDMLESYSKSSSEERDREVVEAYDFTGVWLRIGIIKMHNGVIEKFFPVLENQKYKLFDHQHVVDLYVLYGERSSTYSEEVAYQFTTSIRSFRSDSSAETLTEGKRTTHINWKASDTFLLTYDTEDDGTEYAELYEYSQLPERITNIFTSNRK